MALRHVAQVFGFSLLLCAPAPAPALDSGPDELRLTAQGVEIQVFTYRPAACAEPSILFVFHGLNRNARRVRDEAGDIADGACLMVFAPLFDKDRFPNWRYHRAGVVLDDTVQPPSQWTAPLAQALLDQARGLVANPRARVYLFGHSAGGQFLARLAAYSPLNGVDRIVIANPSVYVVPSLAEGAPYGFGGVFSNAHANARLRDYLAMPITVYLGQHDTGARDLVVTPAARRQGGNRLERGRNHYAAGRKLAHERGWPFAWSLVEAPRVGHSSGGMLRATALYLALALPVPASSQRANREPLPWPALFAGVGPAPTRRAGLPPR